MPPFSYRIVHEEAEELAWAVYRGWEQNPRYKLIARFDARFLAETFISNPKNHL